MDTKKVSAAGRERIVWGPLYRRYGIISILLLEMLIWTLLSPVFLTTSNLVNVVRQASFIGVVAVGQTFVILTAGIDLSVGSLVAFSAIIAAGAMERVDSACLGVLIALSIGILSGAIAGTITTRLRVPAFITTLSMMAMLRAATLLYRGGTPIAITNDRFIAFGQGYWGSIPIPIVISLGAYLVGHWVLSNTKYGRYIYAIGGNVTAARLAGIRVSRIVTSAYIISGFLAALGGVMIAGRLRTATPLAGQDLEFDVIAAVIVGGTSLFGGKGTLWGTLTGVLIIALLRNGLTLMNVSGFWQQFATGAVVLTAVLLDRLLVSREQ